MAKAVKKPAAKTKKPAKTATKKKPVAKKPVAKKVAAKKKPAKKAVAKKAVTKKVIVKKLAAKKPAVKKAVAKKSAPKKAVKKIAVKKVAAKKLVAKKSVAKKVAAKKAIVKKIAVKKPVAKKAAAKKSSPKKSAPKKGEATVAIELDTASDAEIEDAIETVVDEAIGDGAVYGDDVEFADDDVELDEEIEEEYEETTTSSVVVPLTPQNVGGLPEQMRDAVMKVLDERQAEDIVLVPLAGRSSLADYVIIASGRASRQVSALADYLREAFFKLGVRNIRIEGQSEANWVLVDAGDVIVHLFRPEVRSYYDVDAIWASKHPKN